MKSIVYILFLFTGQQWNSTASASCFSFFLEIIYPWIPSFFEKVRKSEILSFFIIVPDGDLNTDNEFTFATNRLVAKQNWPLNTPLFQELFAVGHLQYFVAIL